MFRTSIAVTLLAILTCSNAQAQTAPSATSKLKNWWNSQSQQYAQRNRRLLRRKPIKDSNIQQTAGETSRRMVYPPKVTMTPSQRVQHRIVHVPGRGTVRVPQQTSTNARPASTRTNQVPTRTAIARRPAPTQRGPVATRPTQVRTAKAPLRPVPVRSVSQHGGAPTAAGSYGGGAGGGMSMGQYPATGASLYPSPVPNVPYQIGGSAITNQAFYPHEMLYAHKYKALYAPYYYRVNGHWGVTPFGVWSQEDWKVEGTEVEVEYRSHISPFAGFKPPFVR